MTKDAVRGLSAMGAVQLFHISEDPGIKIFRPRPSRSSHLRVEGDVVWAVNQDRLYNYLVPRNCPRLSFYAKDSTRQEDIDAWLNGDRAKRVIVLESGRLARVLDTTLVRYEFDPTHFTLFHAEAGYYHSQRPETPIAVETIAHPLEHLLAEGVEVRLTPALWDIRERILRSSLGFSFARMNHAAPPAAGYDAYLPI